MREARLRLVGGDRLVGGGQEGGGLVAGDRPAQQQVTLLAPLRKRILAHGAGCSSGCGFGG